MNKTDSLLIIDDMLIEPEQDNPFYDDYFDSTIPDIRHGYGLRNDNLHRAIVLLHCEKNRLTAPIPTNDLNNAIFYLNNFDNDMHCWRNAIEDELIYSYGKDTHISELMKEAAEQGVSIPVREKAMEAARINGRVICDALLLMEHIDSIFNCMEEIFEKTDKMQNMIKSYNSSSNSSAVMQLMEEYRLKVLSLICEADSRYKYVQEVSIDFEKNNNLRTRLLQLFIALKSAGKSKKKLSSNDILYINCTPGNKKYFSTK
ncbi:MAG: hypothetical protein J1F11_06380 [Oscillospiraceae bacterium]|nr:hypothetical protein [Oscillospiraceae bacterium]